MASLSDFQAALGSVADELGQREVHLAALGSHVRRKLSDFSPEEYGYASFTELLEACTLLGELRFGERSEDRWFVFSNIAQSAEISPTGYEIVRSVWDVCVDVGPRPAWLDLMRIGQLEMDPSKVADESERYIEVPRFGRARQITLLRAFSADRSEEEKSPLLAVVESWSSDVSPYSRLLQGLEKIGLRQAWLVYLRRAVEEELRSWASQHGIPPDELFNRRGHSKKKPRVAPLPKRHTRDMDEPEFRAFLKSAIDEMTVVELSQWSVPARLLLKKDRC